MRKYVISALFVLFISGMSQAQDYKIGIKVAPTLSNVRTSAEGSTDVTRDGSAVKFLLGAFVDIQFKENYYFSGGINFASKVSKFNATTLGGNVTEEYDHEYLQIPLLLKLYTNEILLDTKLFFNFGLVPELRLNTAFQSEGSTRNPIIEEWSNFDLAGNFGGGIERGIGVNTRIFAALNYNIGFLNQVQSHARAFEGIVLKSNLFSLDFGIKF